MGLLLNNQAHLGFLWFTGDVLSQKVEGRGWSDWDFVRTARVTSYGLFIAGRLFLPLGSC